MTSEAQPSDLLFYWEAWFLPRRCCAKKDAYVLGFVIDLCHTFFLLEVCKIQVVDLQELKLSGF